MPFVKPIKPVGVNPALKEDRMPVIKVFNGDTWILDAQVWDPVTMMPGTPDNVKLSFVLTENRFVAQPFWTAKWYDGILPDENIPGLVHIRIPAEVSAELRRGVYAFSLTSTDLLDTVVDTQLKGHFQVEYEPTSPNHNIPYREKTKSESSKGESVPSEIEKTIKRLKEAAKNAGPMETGYDIVDNVSRIIDALK